MNTKTIKNSNVIMHELVLPNDTNVLGNVHGGRVMCLMDICAAMSAYKHARMPVVTASVDRLDFLAPAKKGDILKLQSSVNYAHKTSMEIGVRIDAEDPFTGEVKHTATAYLTFVAIDDNNKPTEIPKIIPESDDEKHYRLGTLSMQKKNISADLKISGKQRADWKDFSIVKQAPFKPNVALAFSACEESWHAVHKVGKMKEPRISLQTFIMKSNDRTKGKERVGSCS